jgi:hypothetical protein
VTALFKNGNSNAVEEMMPHFTWVHHNGTVRPRVGSGGDGFQILRIASNISNKQSLTADKGWSSSLEVSPENDNSSPYKPVCYEMLQDLDRLFGAF